MRVLVACEESGTVRRAFRSLGHDAISVDLQESEDDSEYHIVGDDLDYLDQDWDLLIAHPPCTYLCNSGVMWLHRQPERWDKMEDGADFFWEFIAAEIPKICVENPIMHKYAKKIIGAHQTQVIQPWRFGHPEQKATCLWLKGLPELEETNNVKEKMLRLPKSERQRMHWLPPGPERAKLRSKTYEGIAQAMAEQWGTYE